MTMVEKNKDDVANQEKKPKAPVNKVYPRIFRQVNYADKTVDFEIVIPGVKKEDITLKALPTWFHLCARRPEARVEYSANVNFGVEVVPEKTTAKYYNGLLKVKGHVRDPLDDARDVEL